jgi:amino acid transporter, AAT family
VVSGSASFAGLTHPRSGFVFAKQGQAPRLFQNTSPGGVPRRAIQVSSIALLFGVLLNYLVPAKVFVWVTSIATFAAIWTWTVILLSQMKFRKSLSGTERDRLAFRMPFYPYSSWLALAFLALVIVLMAYFPDTQVAFARRPTVASAADSAFLWVQTQCHPHPEFHFRGAFISSRFI